MGSESGLGEMAQAESAANIPNACFTETSDSFTEECLICIHENGYLIHIGIDFLLHLWQLLPSCHSNVRRTTFFLVDTFAISSREDILIEVFCYDVE